MVGSVSFQFFAQAFCYLLIEVAVLICSFGFHFSTLAGKFLFFFVFFHFLCTQFLWSRVRCTSCTSGRILSFSLSCRISFQLRILTLQRHFFHVRLDICPGSSSFICFSSHSCWAVFCCFSSGLWRNTLKAASSTTGSYQLLAYGWINQWPFPASLYCWAFKFPSSTWSLRRSSKRMAFSRCSASDVRWLHLSFRICSIFVFDCSTLVFFFSFSCTLSFHLTISWMNISGLSGKWVFLFISFIIFFWSCSLFFSDTVKMGFPWVSWENWTSWLFCAFCKKSAVLRNDDLLIIAFSVDKHKVCSWRGLTSTPGGLRASLALVMGSVFSLHFLKIALWEDYILSSDFTFFKTVSPFTIKISITVHTRISQEISGRSGMCLKLPAITSRALFRRSMTS